MIFSPWIHQLDPSVVLSILHTAIIVVKSEVCIRPRVLGILCSTTAATMATATTRSITNCEGCDSFQKNGTRPTLHTHNIKTFESNSVKKRISSAFVSQRRTTLHLFLQHRQPLHVEIEHSHSESMGRVKPRTEVTKTNRFVDTLKAAEISKL